MRSNMNSPAERASRAHSVEWLGDEGIRSALDGMVRRFLGRAANAVGGSPRGGRAEASRPEHADESKSCCASTCCA